MVSWILTIGCLSFTAWMWYDIYQMTLKANQRKLKYVRFADEMQLLSELRKENRELKEKIKEYEKITKEVYQTKAVVYSNKYL